MKANIWIEKTGTTLRLVWRHEGKKKQLSLGVRDDRAGRAYAESRKSEIALDILSGNYDPTLLKYKPRKLGKNPFCHQPSKLRQKLFSRLVSKLVQPSPNSNSAGGILIPNQGMLINTIPVLEAQASSAIENIVTTADRLFQFASSHLH